MLNNRIAQRQVEECNRLTEKGGDQKFSCAPVELISRNEKKEKKGNDSLDPFSWGKRGTQRFEIPRNTAYGRYPWKEPLSFSLWKANFSVIKSNEMRSCSLAELVRLENAICRGKSFRKISVSTWPCAFLRDPTTLACSQLFFLFFFSSSFLSPRENLFARTLDGI